MRDFRQAYRGFLGFAINRSHHQVTASRLRTIAISPSEPDQRHCRHTERAEDRPLSSSSFYFEEASAPYKSLNERLVQPCWSGTFC